MWKWILFPEGGRSRHKGKHTLLKKLHFYTTSADTGLLQLINDYFFESIRFTAAPKSVHTPVEISILCESLSAAANSFPVVADGGGNSSTSAVASTIFDGSSESDTRIGLFVLLWTQTCSLVFVERCSVVQQTVSFLTLFKYRSCKFLPHFTWSWTVNGRSSGCRTFAGV